jgi:hypothetical protein
LFVCLFVCLVVFFSAPLHDGWHADSERLRASAGRTLSRKLYRNAIRDTLRSIAAHRCCASLRIAAHRCASLLIAAAHSLPSDRTRPTATPTARRARRSFDEMRGSGMSPLRTASRPRRVSSVRADARGCSRILWPRASCGGWMDGGMHYIGQALSVPVFEAQPSPLPSPFTLAMCDFDLSS